MTYEGLAQENSVYDVQVLFLWTFSNNPVEMGQLQNLIKKLNYCSEFQNNHCVQP